MLLPLDSRPQSSNAGKIHNEYLCVHHLVLRSPKVIRGRVSIGAAIVQVLEQAQEKTHRQRLYTQERSFMQVQMGHK